MKPTTCILDPFPTTLIKSHLSAISPLITKIINLSLNSGHVPSALKAAVIKPLLKNPSLDPEVLANYRPISNLEKFQSGFRSAHSTETPLVRVTNNLLMTADAGPPSLLIFLDLTAAFDTIDHLILLKLLNDDIGLSYTPLDWFTSYLSKGTHFVKVQNASSNMQCPSRVCTWTIAFHLIDASPWSYHQPVRNFIPLLHR